MPGARAYRLAVMSAFDQFEGRVRRLAVRTAEAVISRLGDGDMDAGLDRTTTIAYRWRGEIYRQLYPATFGRGLKIGANLVLKNGSRIRVGDRCLLQHSVLLVASKGEFGGDPGIELGARTFLNVGTSIASHVDRVVIGEDVLFAPNVMVIDAEHGYSDPLLPVAAQGMTGRGPITIGAGSWVATGAVILGGTEIAPRSVVAANSVVRGRFPTRAIIGGIPARVLRELDT